MKRIILNYLLLLFPFISPAQSYLGISTALDCAQIQANYPNTNPNYYYPLFIENDGYQARSLLIGINGEQYLFDKISMSLRLFYTKKEFNALGAGIVKIEGIRYSAYNGNLIFKWHPLDYISLGGGLSISYLYKKREYYKDGAENIIPFGDEKQHGTILMAGLLFKNISLEPYFLYGFLLKKQDKETNLFKPINSIGVSLSYLFRVSKKKK